jgi:hypothetical protein
MARLSRGHWDILDGPSDMAICVDGLRGRELEFKTTHGAALIIINGLMRALPNGTMSYRAIIDASCRHSCHSFSDRICLFGRAVNIEKNDLTDPTPDQVFLFYNPRKREGTLYFIDNNQDNLIIDFAKMEILLQEKPTVEPETEVKPKVVPRRIHTLDYLGRIYWDIEKQKRQALKALSLRGLLKNLPIENMLDWLQGEKTDFSLFPIEIIRAMDFDANTRIWLLQQIVQDIFYQHMVDFCATQKIANPDLIIFKEIFQTLIANSQFEKEVRLRLDDQPQTHKHLMLICSILNSSEDDYRLDLILQELGFGDWYFRCHGSDVSISLVRSSHCTGAFEPDLELSISTKQY